MINEGLIVVIVNKMFNIKDTYIYCSIGSLLLLPYQGFL